MRNLNTQTGVDVMRMDAGLDTGPIATREIIKIHTDETAGDLTSRLAAIAAKLAVNALRSMESGLLEFREQSAIGVSCAHKIKESEAEIDWTQSAEAVRNQIDGLSPSPGAFSRVPIRDEHIKFRRAEVTTGSGPPGMLLTEDMRIAGREGAVRILQVQRPGKSIMSGRELIMAGGLFQE